MTPEEFRKHAHEAVDWVADYLESIEDYPVKSRVAPKEIYNSLPEHPPQNEEPFKLLMKDLNEKILPGVTHWQHPNFHAYFPANSSFPSIIGEIITSGIAAQCMVWETSPAAAELEEKMMEWLKEMMRLPANWVGVIQDTASTSTLAAILTAREQKTEYRINKQGFEQQKLRVYCTTETHSSIEKAVKISGIGKENLVKISVGEELSMQPKALELAIQQDLEAGFTPLCVITTLGTTSTLAFDPAAEIGTICQKYAVWHHIDAAYAGNALVLPELDWLREGLDTADSFVFNPHKWLMTNFDCSVYYVKDKEALLKTFEILPEYLKTKTRGQVNDYRDWGIPLGRRFRALKLWFVIRTYGVEGIRNTIRQHNAFGQWLNLKIESHPDFELVTPSRMNMVVFRMVNHQDSLEELNTKNEQLLNVINDSGKAYLTHTKVHGIYALRLVTGQTYMTQKHVEKVWELINTYSLPFRRN